MKRKVLLLTLSILMMCTGFVFNGWRDQMASGNQQFKSGEVSKAIQSFNQALVEAPDEPTLHYNLGNSLYQKGDFAGAEDQYAKTLDLTKDQKLREDVEYNLGNLKYRQGESLVDENPLAALDQFESALQHYEQVIRNNPTDQNAKYNYEFVQKKIKQLEKQLTEEENPANNSPEQKNQDQQKDQQEGQQKGSEATLNKQEEAVQSLAPEDVKEDEENDGEKDLTPSETQQINGLSEEAARQLLEQFNEEIDQFMPIQPRSDEPSSSFKDW